MVRSSPPSSLPSSADQEQATAMSSRPQGSNQGSQGGPGGPAEEPPAAASVQQGNAAGGAADQQAVQPGGPPQVIGVPVGLPADLASVVSAPPMQGGGQGPPLALHLNIGAGPSINHGSALSSRGGADPYGRIGLLRC